MPFLLLFVEALLFSRYLLINPNNVLPWDFRFWHLPHAVFVARALHDHEVPLWNPFIYCGMPFAANVQTALFYPLRFAAVLAGTALGEERMVYCLEADWILSMFLGGVFAYLLGRRLGLNTAPALLAASTYELGAFFASQAEHLGAIEIAAWLPLVWLSMLGLPSRKWTLILGAALALAVMGGFTPLTVVVFLSTLFFVRRNNLISWLAALFFALLLAAVIVLPAAQLRDLSVSRFRRDWVGTGGGLPLYGLRTLFWANAKPVPGDLTFQYLYCGAIALILAITRLKSIWGLILGIAAVLMLGDSTPIGASFHSLLPSFVKDAYYPQQWLAPFTLALAVCAGFGLQTLSKRAKWAVLALPLASAELLVFNPGRPFNLTTLAAEPGITRDSFNGSKELLTEVKAATLSNRLDTMNDSPDWVASAMITGIPTASGQDPMAMIRYMQVRDIFCDGKRYGDYYQVVDLQSPLLSALNIGAVVTRTKPPQPYREIPGGYVWLNRSVLPRFYFPQRAVRAVSLEDSITKIRADPSTVTVEGPINGTSATGIVRIDSYRRNTIDLTVSSSAPAFLASSEPNYPGWNATIDGQATPIYNANAAFRGINVPSGEHRIQFVFRPLLVYFSFSLSVVSWLAWMVFLKKSLSDSASAPRGVDRRQPVYR